MSSSRKARSKDDYGFKKSSGVDYSQVLDRHVDDARFERQRAIRAGTAATPVAPSSTTADASKKPPAQSATMDAFMRMMTGKDERTIADRISDPNRPTWEQYKKENAEKLDLFNGNEEKEMVAYRKKLDAARDKALARRGSSSHNSTKDKKRKKKKRSASSDSSSASSGSDSASDNDRHRSRRKSSSRKKKKSKRRRRSATSDSDASDAENDASDAGNDQRTSRKKKHKHKHKKASKSRERSPSPVRLSSFFNHSGSDDDK